MKTFFSIGHFTDDNDNNLIQCNMQYQVNIFGFIITESVPL